MERKKTITTSALENLKRFTPEGARMGQRKGLATRLDNIEIREQLRKNALAFQKIIHELPEFSGTDLLKFCVHQAIATEDYVALYQLGKELAEYERPKLQRVENLNKDASRDLSDAELLEAAKREGLVPAGVDMSKFLPMGGTVVQLKTRKRKKVAPEGIQSTAPLKAPPGFTRTKPLRVK